MARSTALQKMLGEILAAVERPTGGQNFAASLARNRHIQQLMAAKALDAAEAADPTFIEGFLGIDAEFPHLAGACAERAVAAAEERWPGFRELCEEMVARELEFMRKAGPVA